MATKPDFMALAIAEAEIGITSHHGGPFGAVIVRNGEVIGRGHNCVLLNHDPTCHGEMEAIRNACATLGTHDLTGAELYTTAEPCPMCLGGILWANIRTVYYGCTRKDTDAIGFRDNEFYECFYGNRTLFSLKEKKRRACLALFKRYVAASDGKRY